MTQADITLQAMMKEDLMREIVRTFGLEGSTPEKRAEMIAEMGGVVQDRVAIELLKKLPEHAREEFVRLIGSNDLPTLYAHVSDHIDNADAFIQQVITQEVAEIMKDYQAVLSVQ